VLRRDTHVLPSWRARRRATAAAPSGPAQTRGPWFSVEMGWARPKADSWAMGRVPEGAITAEMCACGVTVVRGRDWCWGDDDGGPGRPGVIQDGPAPPGWCLVLSHTHISVCVCVASAGPAGTAGLAPPRTRAWPEGAEAVCA
jgi:hypothetical protein